MNKRDRIIKAIEDTAMPDCAEYVKGCYSHRTVVAIADAILESLEEMEDTV